ncbi:hypothetical protein M9H77_16313 [Catharanthus roseus]|uniref:Uncharacterized protein n=1 Tax=Catharanthus roseus TaxID=4058 RepID=A0ACC0B1E9_CATRO|nr:hypothetical protein M9H77_16313 [Catharanthus roseus]
MAPKTRSGKKVLGTVVTKKIVKEKVEVVVSPNGESEEDERIREIVSETIRENEKLEIISSSPPSKKSPVKIVTVVDKSGKQNQQSPPPPPAEVDEDDAETQPTSQPEITPTPTPPKLSESKKRKSKSEEKSPKGSTGKRRKKKAKVGGGAEYKRYVFMVMKQVHPDMGISSKAMTIINNLMSDMFERIADEASKLSKYIGRVTLSSLEIQDAVKLVLPGELGKHAIAEGSKAVANYAAYVTGGNNSKFKSKSKS